MTQLPDFSERIPGAVALDLDGTALNSASRMSSRTTRAVLGLIDLGVPVIIATARPERVVPVLVGPEIAARSSLVHMSGAAAVGRYPLSGQAWNPIDPGQARLAWEIVMSSKESPRMVIEVDGRRFAVNDESDAQELWMFNAATPDMLLSYEEALASGPAKVSVNGLGNDLSAVVARLVAELAPDTTVIPAVDNAFINVQSDKATKSGAVLELIAPSGIDLEDILSFGDDLPDIDLLRNTGWPVAVENAIPEVKQAARFLTASNDDDGVAVVLEKLAEAVGSRNG